MSYMGGQYGAPPGGISPEIQQWFNAVDVNRSGKIDAKKLQMALVNGKGGHFSDKACDLMIKMFDGDNTGTIEIHEFQQLYNYINSWISTFRAYDKDGSGSIEEPELAIALQAMGFRFSDDFYKFIIGRNDPLNKRDITVDQFIVFCIQLQKATDLFRSKDTQQQGIVSISYEDFIRAVFQII